MTEEEKRRISQVNFEVEQLRRERVLLESLVEDMEDGFSLEEPERTTIGNLDGIICAAFDRLGQIGAADNEEAIEHRDAIIALREQIRTLSNED